MTDELHHAARVCDTGSGVPCDRRIIHLDLVLAKEYLGMLANAQVHNIEESNIGQLQSALKYLSDLYASRAGRQAHANLPIPARWFPQGDVANRQRRGFTMIGRRIFNAGGAFGLYRRLAIGRVSGLATAHVRLAAKKRTYSIYERMFVSREVPKIETLFRRGFSLGAIAKELNRTGAVRTASGTWNAEDVARVLLFARALREADRHEQFQRAATPFHEVTLRGARRPRQ